MRKAFYLLVLLSLTTFGQTTKEEYNELGLQEASNENYTKAIAYYDKAIAIDPKLIGAYINKANVYYELKDYPNALKNIAQVMQLNPNHAIAYNNRGMVYKEQKKYTEALADYNKAISLDKYYFMPYINKIRAYFLLNKPEDAKTTALNLIKEMPDKADTYLVTYIYYTEINDLSGALNELNTAVAMDKTNQEALHQRALFKDDINDDQGAVADYSTLIFMNPKEAKYYYGRSSAYYDLKNYDTVIEDCKNAIALNNDYYAAYAMLGDVYDTYGYVDKSVANYEKAISLRPTDEHAYNELNKVYYAKKEYTKCIEVLNRILTLKPNMISSLEYRASAKAHLPDNKGALEDYQKLIALNPTNYFYYINRANVEEEEKNLTAACEDMKKAKQMIKNRVSEEYFIAHNFQMKNCRSSFSPKILKVDDLYQEAVALYNEQKIDLVIQKYDEMIKIIPDSSFLYYNRGKMKRALEKHEDAILDYKKAVQFDKKNVEAWVAMGVSYMYSKKNDEAIKALIEAIKADENYAMSYHNLALIYADRKEYTKAVPNFDKAIEKDPKYIMAYYSLGLCYLEMKEKDKACYNFKKAQSLGHSASRIKIISECE